MVDANVVIAAFLRDSTVRRVLALSVLQLFVPDFLGSSSETIFPSSGVERASRKARRTKW